VRAGLASISVANSLTSRKRSAGSLAMARASVASSQAGKSGRRVSGGFGRARRCGAYPPLLIGIVQARAILDPCIAADGQTQLLQHVHERRLLLGKAVQVSFGS
jgi:hypothetical protein